MALQVLAAAILVFGSCHNKRMNFTSDASIDGKLVYGYEDGWHWSKNNGHYNKGRNFFWIHWEIGDRNPHQVKLHIECPKAEIDAELNAIKCEMVEDFLAAHFVDLVEENGYSYKAGKRIKPEHRAKFKCTSPFHVVLNDEQS